jgi:hypothetical protein
MGVHLLQQVKKQKAKVPRTRGLFPVFSAPFLHFEKGK